MAKINRTSWSSATYDTAQEAAEFVNKNPVAMIVFDTTVSEPDQALVMEALGDRAETTEFVTLDPAEEDDVKALLAKLKGG
ncbi:MAG: hypothetical protein NT039_02660 [Candidatus Berkelbacteria bacterium]|nr:hypothetical protein [Candidatus Berkelbacteria bacterium]